MIARWLLIAGLVAGLGCGDSKGGIADGAERGNCFSNGTCNAGLTCLSGLCVNAVSATQALSEAIAFEGGVSRVGNIPNVTNEGITLIPDDLSLVLTPGDGPTLMSLTADNPNESDDPVDLTLMQFADTDDHIEVERAPVAAGEDATKIELTFSLKDSVCDRLCNTVYAVEMEQTVQLKSGEVGARATRTLTLDCKKRGDRKLCTGKEVDATPTPTKKRDAGDASGDVDAGSPADPQDAGESGLDAGTDAPTCVWTGDENPNMCKVCAADATCDAPNYTDNGDGTVTSSCCGLVWQQVVDGTGGDGVGNYTWDAAKAYCDGLTLAGGAWRLPTIEELWSLVVPSQTPPAPTIDRTAFPNTPAVEFWSSSPHVGSVGSAWGVYFLTGYSIYGGTSYASRVRCVR